jgi:hypothetical protein
VTCPECGKGEKAIATKVRRGLSDNERLFLDAVESRMPSQLHFYWWIRGRASDRVLTVGYTQRFASAFRKLSIHETVSPMQIDAYRNGPAAFGQCVGERLADAVRAMIGVRP